MLIVTTDEVESINEEGGEVKDVGYVLETEMLCQGFDQCLVRLTKEQVVIGSNFG